MGRKRGPRPAAFPMLRWSLLGSSRTFWVAAKKKKACARRQAPIWLDHPFFFFPLSLYLSRKGPLHHSLTPIPGRWKWLDRNSILPKLFDQPSKCLSFDYEHFNPSGISPSRVDEAGAMVVYIVSRPILKNSSESAPNATTI